MASYIFHGRSSNPKRAFISWLKDQLLENQIAVSTPKLPHSDFPSPKRWQKYMENLFDNSEEPEYIVAHSLSTHSVLDAIATGKYAPEGIFLVAPFQEINYDAVLDRTLEELDERGWPNFLTQWVLNYSIKTAKKWSETPINWEGVKPFQESIHLYFSTNDPYVSPEQVKLFEKNIPNASFHLMTDSGHFSKEDGYETFPKLLTDILDSQKSEFDADYNRNL